MTASHTQGFEMPSQSVFETQMSELKSDMREMREAITKMAEALTKISVLEERNHVTNTAVEKIANLIDKLTDKINHVEMEQIKFQATVGGMTKAMKFMWGAFGGGVIYLGSEVIKYFS